MKLRYLKTDSYYGLLSELNNHKSLFVENLQSGTYDKWFEEDKTHQIEGINLPKYNPIKRNYISDHKFAIELFESLSSLTRFQITDKRLWGYLTMKLYRKECYKFGSYDTVSSPSVKKIKENFFYEGRGNSTASRNLLSKVFWAVRQTVDEESKDKYYFTKLLIKDDNSQLFQDLTQRRSLFDNKELVYGILLFMENKKSDESKIITPILLNHLYSFDLSQLSRYEIKELVEVFYKDLKNIGRSEIEKKGLFRFR